MAAAGPERGDPDGRHPHPGGTQPDRGRPGDERPGGTQPGDERPGGTQPGGAGGTGPTPNTPGATARVAGVSGDDATTEPRPAPGRGSAADPTTVQQTAAARDAPAGGGIPAAGHPPTAGDATTAGQRPMAADAPAGGGIPATGHPPTAGDATTARHPPTSGDTATGHIGPADPATAPVPPRWTGSAAVPPRAARRRRGRLVDDGETRPVYPPPARDPDDPPTLEWPAPPTTLTWPAAAPPGRRPDRYPPGRYATDPTAPYPTGPAAPYPAARYAPGPYPPRPGPGVRPPRRRRRRRWPWVMLVLAVLTVLCCCGCAGAVRPYLTQYPTTVTLPARAAGLSRMDDPDSRRIEAQLRVRLRTRQLLAESVFAGRYDAPTGDGEPVTLFGTTGFRLSPARDLDAALSDLGDQLTPSGVRDVPAGDLGGLQRCGGGASGGTAVTVCGWADHGSLAIGLFPGRDFDQGAQLLRDLRAAVTHRANRIG